MAYQTIPGSPIAAAVDDIVADWPIASVRWYALDGTSGNDSNPGYSDTTSADAGTKAKLTLAGLASILPRVGRGRKLCIVIRAGDYSAQGGLDVLLSSMDGYAAGFPVVVATDTVASAGATAFAGDAADRTCLGMTTATGMNAAGYNPTGALSASLIQCVLNGGGAPSFAAEPAVPMGMRMRFASNTATAALRNICRQVRVVSGGDTITPLSAFPAVPDAADVFYLEMPNAIFAASVVNIPGNSAASVAGFKTSGTLTFLNGRVTFAGCQFSGVQTRGGDFQPYLSYTDETSTSRTVGMGVRVDTTVTSFAVGAWNASNNPAFALSVVSTTSFNSLAGFGISNGATTWAGITVVNCQGIPENQASQVSTSIGGRSHSSQPPVRIRGAVNTGSPAKAGGIVIQGSRLTLDAISFESMGANPAIVVRGTSDVTVSNDQVGSTGNTDVGLDLTQSFNSRINIIDAPTVTGSAGDVRLAGGQIVTWAQAAATGIVDSNGNRFVSAAVAGPLTIQKFSGAIVSSAGGATISYLADTGAQLIVANLAAHRYPTSMRLAMRLRVTKLYAAGVLTNNITCTLYKNAVATAMTVTVLTADAVNTKYVDSAHPILFVDGDDYDLRLDDAADALMGVGPVSAALEWAV